MRKRKLVDARMTVDKEQVLEDDFGPYLQDLVELDVRFAPAQQSFACVRLELTVPLWCWIITPISINTFF